MLRQVPLGDCEMSVLDEGAGSPLLFVHGFPLDHSMWQHQRQHFLRSHRCIVPDLRGFGQSQFVADEITMRQLADDLAQMLRALSIDQPLTFCGLSMGGYVAWQFWRHHGSLLGKLILCDTKAAADSEEMARGRRLMAQQVLQEGSEVACRSMSPKLVAGTTSESQPSLVASLADTIRNTPPQTIAAIQRGMAIRCDMTPFLASVQQPTLVVCGDQDVITPVGEMRAMAEAMPAATFAEIPNAGHLAPLENPLAVNSAIEEFLASTS